MSKRCKYVLGIVMDNIIWKTSVPTEMGYYEVKEHNGVTRKIFFHPKELVDIDYFMSCVSAWYKISDSPKISSK